MGAGGGEFDPLVVGGENWYMASSAFFMELERALVKLASSSTWAKGSPGRMQAWLFDLKGAEKKHAKCFFLFPGLDWGAQ